jgi:hypothetical protein
LEGPKRNIYPKREKLRKYSKNVTKYTKYNYDLAAPDWINEELNLKLARYAPPPELEALLQSRVNDDLE